MSDEKSEIVSVRLPAQLMKSLREQAEASGTTVSHLVRNRVNLKPVRPTIHIGAPPNYADTREVTTTHHYETSNGSLTKASYGFNA